MKGTLFDASALAALVMKEEGWERLLALLPSSTLNLAFAEAYNAVWKHAKVLKDLSEEEEALALKALEEAKGLFNVLPMEKYLKRSYEIAKAFSLTVYDSLYLAACEEEDLRLVTLDSRQKEVAKKLGLEVV